MIAHMTPVVPVIRRPMADLKRPGDGRLRATPLARSHAASAGIDLGSVAGTGPRGRILFGDVERFIAQAAKQHPPQPVAPALSDGRYTRVPLDGMRSAIAARVSAAKRDVPHFYLSVDCRMEKLLAVRAEINASAADAARLSINDCLVKAWAVALKNVPGANASWDGGSIIQHHDVDVAVAVGVPGGLFTPVIRNAANKRLTQISAEIRELAARAKVRSLSPGEYSGGSTAISNLGMYGVGSFAAIINPPHGTILAVGAVQERAWSEAGTLSSAAAMSVTLSCDHRVIDGTVGAEALARFRELVERPLLMLA